MSAAEHGLLTLTTDFGVRDGYVAALKGSILARAPALRLVDVTHEIEPGAIASAAFVLGQAAPHFPEGTVHLAVVDPGVGSGRRALACEIGPHRYVAPDNGLLTPFLDGAFRVHELTRPQLWNPRVSPVFHGRDVFGPVAAHLAAGGALDDVGPRVDPASLVRLPEPRARREASEWTGEVVHVDRFGNLITNLVPEAAPGSEARVEIGGRSLPVHRIYADVGEGELVALIGSSGRLEIACRAGSAARVLGVSVGSVVAFRAA